MINKYYEIRDKCRIGLIRYLSDALKIIPALEKPVMMDIGCGTGVTTLWLAENFNGIITAIDSDIKPLKWLQEKVKVQNLEDRIITINKSFFDIKFADDGYDIILAEGFLNIVGFQKGFPKIIKLLGTSRFFVIHDEYKDQRSKCRLITKHNCKICDSFILDEHVWWNDYYKQLEEEIYSPENKNLAGFFKSDMHEIESYRVNPTLFRSMYYIIQKL
jgi:SAM-dependent methyltransferase